MRRVFLLIFYSLAVVMGDECGGLALKVWDFPGPVQFRDRPGPYRTISLTYDDIVQDNDGTHIKSLVINMFATMWPDLLKHNPDFIRTMATPIVKVTRGIEQHSFYTLREYQTWKRGGDDANGGIEGDDRRVQERKGWKTKYFKISPIFLNLLRFSFDV